MDLELPPDPRVDEVTRTPDLWAALALTAQMHDSVSREEIAALLGYAVAALGPFTVDSGQPDERGTTGAKSTWEYVLTTTTDTRLVVRSPTKPTPDQVTLVELVADHTRAALEATTARSALSRQRDTAATVDKLSRTVDRLRNESKVRTVLSQLSTTLAGERAIVSALADLTGMDVGLEDAFGNLRFAAPPVDARRYRRIGGHNHTDVVSRASASAHPVRDGQRLFQVVRPQHDLLGIVFLVDPHHRADVFEQFALEHGASALAMHMTHQRSIAETEMRLRRELGADLLDGLDNDTACARADALGYDLRKPQRVHTIRWAADTDPHSVASIVARHCENTHEGALIVRRGRLTVVITAGDVSPAPEYEVLCHTLGGSGVLGVGTTAPDPSAIPRSLADSIRALHIREHSLHPEGIVAFDDLGVYRILDTRSDSNDVHEFVREWLGVLLDYDRRHRSSMTETLTQYLEFGGRYDDTARALQIHRSTLRYRMGRIHELTGRDLHDVDTRLNLHLATRALQVISGFETGSGNA